MDFNSIRSTINMTQFNVIRLNQTTAYREGVTRHSDEGLILKNSFLRGSMHTAQIRQWLTAEPYGTITLGYFADKGGKVMRDNFDSGQLLAISVPLTVKQALEDSYTANHACIAFPMADSSIDSPMTTVLFALNQPVYSVDRFEDLLSALRSRYDNPMTDAMHMVHGSSNLQGKLRYYNHAAVLTPETLIRTPRLA